MRVIPLIRSFTRDWLHYGRRTAVWNARFQLGFWIGGFKQARR